MREEFAMALEKLREVLWVETYEACMFLAPFALLGTAFLLGWTMGSGEWGAGAVMGGCMAVLLFAHYVMPNRWDGEIPIGTRTVLWGYHTFWLHPWFVARAWWRVWGFPWDPRLWVAFVVHDLGYWALPNLDGPEGEQHPEWGAGVMARWFDVYTGVHPDDWPKEGAHWWHMAVGRTCDRIWGELWTKDWAADTWYDMVLYHSRFLARRDGAHYSALCVADKLAITLYPPALFMRLVRATGEIHEYMAVAEDRDGGEYRSERERAWYEGMVEYVRRWVAVHRDLREDEMTRRNGKEGGPERYEDD